MILDFITTRFFISLISIILIIVTPFFVWYILKIKGHCSDINIIKSKKNSPNIIKNTYIDRRKKIVIFEYNGYEYLTLLSDNHGFLIDKLNKNENQ